MNTSKQVNVMVGLLMVFLAGTLLYFLWDSVRADDAADRQLRVDAERGGALFAQNCRACHGLTGKGALERAGLPGATLNIATNRLTDPGKLAARQTYLRDTIKCGRVGTLMPPWSLEQGGPLNDSQMQQLVLLITSAASEAGWEYAVEVANGPPSHRPPGDAFDPPRWLTQAVGDSDTILVLNDAHGLKPGDVLRIDAHPYDAVYELVTVVLAPAGSALTDDVTASDTELPVQTAAVFRKGQTLMIEDEKVIVMEAPAVTALAADIVAGDATLTVKDSTGLAAGQTVSVGTEKMKVLSVSGSLLRVQRGVEDTAAGDHKADTAVTVTGNKITVQRGAENSKVSDHRARLAIQQIGDSIKVERGAAGSKAASQAAATELFAGPIPPPAGPLTGSSQGDPPCGQRKYVPTSTPAPSAPIAVTGSVEVQTGDNFFQLQGQKNPTLTVKAGETVSVSVKNMGSAIHNLRFAGPDNKLDTADDIVSDPLAITGGQSGKVSLVLQNAGTFDYRCDFHPIEMKGQVTVQ